MSYQNTLYCLLQHPTLDMYMQANGISDISEKRALEMLEEYGILTITVRPRKSLLGDTDPATRYKVTIPNQDESVPFYGQGQTLLIASLRCLIDILTLTERAAGDAVRAFEAMSDQ